MSKIKIESNLGSITISLYIGNPACLEMSNTNIGFAEIKIGFLIQLSAITLVLAGVATRKWEDKLILDTDY